MNVNVRVFVNGTVTTISEKGCLLTKYTGNLPILHKIIKDIETKPESKHFDNIINANFMLCKWDGNGGLIVMKDITLEELKDLSRYVIKKDINV